MAEPLSVVGILAVAPFPRKSYRSLDQAALPAPQDISKGRNELHPLYSSFCIPQWSRIEADGTA
jgi:hypothetical protein